MIDPMMSADRLTAAQARYALGTADLLAAVDKAAQLVDEHGLTAVAIGGRIDSPATLTRDPDRGEHVPTPTGVDIDASHDPVMFLAWCRALNVLIVRVQRGPFVGLTVTAHRRDLVWHVRGAVMHRPRRRILGGIDVAWQTSSEGIVSVDELARGLALVGYSDRVPTPPQVDPMAGIG